MKPMQLRIISDEALPLELDKHYGGQYKLKTSGIADPREVQYPYVNYDYMGPPVKETKFDALNQMMAVLRMIGSVATSSRMLKAVRKKSKKESNRAIEWMQGQQGWVPVDSNHFWPFAVDIDFDYKNTFGNDGLAGELGIEAFFGSANYGYITEVRGNANEFFQMGIKYERPDLTLPDMTHEKDQYDARHLEDGTENEVERALGAPGPEGADSVTKYVAEGARWQAVEILGKKGGLTNTSKFFISSSAQNVPLENDDFPTYIEFQTLWKRWQDFNNSWGISNSDLKSALTGKLISDKYKGNIDHPTISLSTLKADGKNFDLG
ncbi:hypothetical protein [Reinekea sp. G2M2-21]|uniref:hypothetical protein n=1 Tax=Reinekea sp. G2M2-21 TaxID=2788942 RepID=UPI0018A975EC|nr:hypothetical protein [Reinekea sp. G2M2-21]